MAEPAKSLEAFTADLQREAQALGITPQNYLEAAREPEIAHRGGMLPFVEYDDKSIGWGWPQTALDAKEAFGRFGRGENPQPQDAILAGLAIAGTRFGGLAGRSARGSVAGAERAAAPSGLPSHRAEGASPTRGVEAG